MTASPSPDIQHPAFWILWTNTRTTTQGEKRTPLCLTGMTFCLVCRGGQERLAFSVLWEVTPDVQVLSTTFTKSLICSRAAMTYGQAQDIIDDTENHDEIAVSTVDLGLDIRFETAVHSSSRPLHTTAYKASLDMVRWQRDV